MELTYLISRVPSEKALLPSHYDEQFVVANVDKIKKVTYPSDKQRKSCSAIGSNLEIFDNARLRNYRLASVVEQINSFFPICISNHNQTEFILQSVFLPVIQILALQKFLFLIAHFKFFLSSVV